MSESRPALHVPARDIPVPTSVSEQAQAILARGRLGPSPEYPALDDLQGWRDMIASTDAEVLGMLAMRGGATDAPGPSVAEIDIDGAKVYVITPAGVSDEDRRVYLDLHGGSWILCGGEICRAMGIGAAASVGARTWSVDYRMPPDHPFPVALDDCLAAYRALLKEYRPEQIVVGGTSAGANLAGALILRACDEGLPLPAAAVLGTPAVDLTEAGDTWQTNRGLDNMQTGSAMPAILLYAAGHDLRDPYLSPLFGDFTKGFPPTLLLSGTRDVLLSDTVRLHRKLRAAGVSADLHVFEAAGHGMFLGTAPEDRERAGEIRRFVDEHWAGNGR